MADDRDTFDSIRAAKSAMRKEIRRLRKELPDRSQRSEQIVQRLFCSDWYKASRSVFMYIDMPGEVETRDLFHRMIEDDRRVAVPYCDGPTLRAYWCTSLSELERGTYGILEPSAELRAHPDRQAAIRYFDMIITPAIAVDRSGGRLGQGGGFYDRFIAETRRAGTNTVIIAIAFDCQLVDHVPIALHDMRVDAIATETATYHCHPSRSDG